MSRPLQYEETEHGPWTATHKHKVAGGWMKHRHPLGDPNYRDGFAEPHSHLVVLNERNYVNEDTEPAIYEGSSDD